MPDNKPFIFLTFAIFLLAISPFLLAEGMFFDGIYYCAISHNLAQGIGSFWQPQMETTTQFYGQPPLAFGLQALFYKVLGNSLYIDKIYSVTTFLITALLILSVWKMSGKKWTTGWFPLLLWLCFSLVLWALPNNLLESSMTMFVIASLLCFLLYQKRKKWYWIVFSGVMLCLAFFTKGVTGVFPLVMPLGHALLFRDKKWGGLLKEIGLMSAGLLVPILILFLSSPEACHYMAKYVQVQLMDAFRNTYWITVKTRWFIVLRFLLNSVPHLLIFLLLWLYTRKIKQKIIAQTYIQQRKIFWFLIITGLCGIIPIMISLKQREFYMLAALPFFALAWALLLENVVQQLIAKISVKNNRIFLWISLLLVATGIGSIAVHKNTFSRDRQLLADIHQLLPYIPDRATISMDKSMFEEWKLYPYFARYKSISLDVDNEYDLLLVRDSTMLQNYNSHYSLKCQTKTLLLYGKNE
ncbi:MAG: glycosyltransferase family 39 protein [Bacteroidales bacterium]|jgi:4-amino-4-deoxy-L-arabinose transferase-like glycosyltransferase|nr:glycosyltransferase family 39 protein [Bacteroidales bacterium]